MGSEQSKESGDIFQKAYYMLSHISICLRPQLESEELAQFSSSYEYISLYKDPYYGDSHLLRKTQGNSFCIVQKETLDRKDHLTRMEILRDICVAGEGPGNKNVIKTVVLADLQKVGFLWRKNQVYVKSDYILFDLEKEFQSRIQQNIQFSETQIRIILRQCTKGFLRLELTNYTSLRMKHIYFCNNGEQIKLAHPKLFSYRSNIQEIYEDYSKKSIYLSPEELRALEINDYNYQCGWASNAFSFGMILLSLMTMKELGDLYNYKSCQINFKRLQELIKLCNSYYTYPLISLVQQLLKEKEAQRLTFRSLFNKIQNISMPSSKTVELTLLQEKADLIPKIQKRQQVFKAKHPNYIEALIKPKVSMNGEYMSVTDSKSASTKLQDQQVMAAQRYRYSSGERSIGSYAGDASQMKRQGKGIYQYVDGQLYVGQWHKGKMSGYGKLYFKDKRLRYEGEFEQGLFHGNGIEYAEIQIPQRQKEIDEEYVCIYKGNWIKYEGYYVKDKRQGAGKIYFKFGCWKGNFKNGQPNGDGIYHCYQTNQTTKGHWDNGQLVNYR